MDSVRSPPCDLIVCLSTWSIAKSTHAAGSAQGSRRILPMGATGRFKIVVPGHDDSNGACVVKKRMVLASLKHDDDNDHARRLKKFCSDVQK